MLFGFGSYKSFIAGITTSAGCVFAICTLAAYTLFEGFRPLLRTMQLGMFHSANEHQVVYAVVRRVPIDMVNMLIVLQWATDFLFHQEAMLLHMASIRGGNKNVAPGMLTASTNPTGIALFEQAFSVAFARTKTLPPFDLAGLRQKGLSAKIAGAFNAWCILTGHRKSYPFGVMPPAVISSAEAFYCLSLL